jgi:hypothetical protein
MKYLINESRLLSFFSNMIKEDGLLTAINYAGGINHLLEILGKNDFDDEEKIDEIKETIKKTGLIFLPEYGEPIWYGDNDFEYSQIFNLDRNEVTIIIWDKETHEDAGMYRLHYENLPSEAIDKIFDVIIKIGNEF